MAARRTRYPIGTARSDAIRAARRGRASCVHHHRQCATVGYSFEPPHCHGTELPATPGVAGRTRHGMNDYPAT
jgi:hypothetical protein